jgi:hypothetical protein
MHRRQLLKGITALTAAHCLGLSPSAQANGQRLAAQGIHRLNGEVKVNGQPASVGTLVKPGDTVTTGTNSEAIYVIGQDAYLQRDKSTVTIVGDTVKTGMRVLTGKLLSVFGKGPQRIETATATIGIRGTGCYIESASDRVYFCLCYGKADVASLRATEKVETIETRHHDHPVYLYADGSQTNVPPGVDNHNDDELFLLESLVGRVPPFAAQASKY